jgi:hypothetical protein
MGDQVIRYSTDIKPLFRLRDRISMRIKFDLGNYEDVSSRADKILERLRGGSMPCDGAWPKERVDLFERWMQGGKQP